jgi:hypothetical protein
MISTKQLVALWAASEVDETGLAQVSWLEGAMGLGLSVQDLSDALDELGEEGRVLIDWPSGWIWVPAKSSASKSRLATRAARIPSERLRSLVLAQPSPPSDSLPWGKKIILEEDADEEEEDLLGDRRSEPRSSSSLPREGILPEGHKRKSPIWENSAAQKEELLKVYRDHIAPHFRGKVQSRVRWSLIEGEPTMSDLCDGIRGAGQNEWLIRGPGRDKVRGKMDHALKYWRRYARSWREQHQQVERPVPASLLAEIDRRADRWMEETERVLRGERMAEEDRASAFTRRLQSLRRMVTQWRERSSRASSGL